MADAIFIGIGDSSGCHNDFRDLSIDTTDSFVYQLKQDRSTLAVASEPLDVSGGGIDTGVSDGHHVGTLLKFAQHRHATGKIPSAFDRAIVIPAFWEGTAMTDYWATTGLRQALDTGTGNMGTLAWVQAALDLDPANCIMSILWQHGPNDGGRTETQYRDDVVAMFAEMRSTWRTANSAPILVTGIPPDRVDPALGNATNLTGVIAAQQSLPDYISNCHYIDMTGLPSSSNHGYVHLAAGAVRGGERNDPSASGTVTNPLYVRCSDALDSAGYKFTAAW